MQIKGNYTLSSLFSSANGPFTVTITNVIAKGNASVAVERDGKIRTQDISMDMSFSKLESDFKNLGFMGSIFQSIINGAPNLVFDSMKPFMLKEAYSKLRNEIDSKVKELMGEYRLPNSISPLDMAIGEARRRVREMGFDPMIVRNYNHSIGIFMMQLKNTWIKGVSSFHRVGDLLLGLDNNTVTIGKLPMRKNELKLVDLILFVFGRIKSGNARNRGLGRLGGDGWQRNHHTFGTCTIFCAIYSS